MNVLFVEDNEFLLTDLLDAIELEQIDGGLDWDLFFACDIPSAWQELCRRPFDLLVLDVMLPAWPRVPEQSEGVFLVAWLRGLKPGADPPGGDPQDANRSAPIVLLTNKEKTHVSGEIKKLFKQPLSKLLNIKVIERPDKTGSKQLKELQTFLSGSDEE